MDAAVTSHDIVTTALQARVDPGALVRGIAVHRQGKVLRATLTADGRTLEGRVRGSGGETYRQVVTIRQGHGRALDLRGLCSCPVGEDCKHVVAACLSAAAEILGAQAPPPAPVVSPALADYRVGDWLRRVEQVAGTVAERDAEAYPDRVVDRIRYVVTKSETGAVSMQPWKVRLLKSGGVGGTPRRYNPGTAARGTSALYIRPSDEIICQELEQLRYSYNQRSVGAQTLARAVATGRARLDSAVGLALVTGPARKGGFGWEEMADGTQRLIARDEGAVPVMVLPLHPPYYVDPKSGEAGPFETGLPPELAAVMASAPAVSPEAAQQVVEALAGESRVALPAPKSVAVARRSDVAPVPVLTLGSARERGEGALCVPVLRLAFAYDGADPVPMRAEGEAHSPPVRRAGAEGTVLIDRQTEAEARHADHLMRRGEDFDFLTASEACPTADLLEDVADTDLIFDAVIDEGFRDHTTAPQIMIDEAALGFAAEGVPDLARAGWRIVFDESWDWHLHDGPVAFEAGVETSGIDWFSFSLTVTAGGETLDMLPVILSVIDILPVNGAGELPHDFDLDGFLEDLVLYPQLGSGARIRLEAATLTPIVRAFLEVHGLTGFHLGEAPQLRQLADALEGCGIPWTGDPALLVLADKLNALAAAPQADPPATLHATLRPYQKTGFGWLRALSETGFGGALADDMGLGKTVQALALLAHRHLEEGSDRPSLLVAPTSMVGTWAREAARFVPDLRVLVLHGPDRKAKFGGIADHHLIVTTYPLLHRDHGALFAQPYDLAILDEAQAVKNPASSVSKRIREIDARQRLALTGTPVENNLQELWAIFDWLVPGLLGDRRRFSTQLRYPIEREGSGTAQKLLAARLRPFLLRRTKEEVAADLPPKTVIDERVPLEPKQAALYETLRVAMDARVKRAIKEKGVEKSRITVLDALLKLRQACCDPALVKLDAARKVTESAKRARLMALLEPLVAEGRKVLIFSQFVEMLKLIEADVQAQGWDYAMLTGRTRKRAEQIAKFQEGEVPLFLISLKAGGTGLTLTEADTVILYDPWWNPAVERQAMDRAHRIGQTKPVFVHRLIAEGTVESAIQQMQARKQALADALFEEGAGGRIDLGEDDIAALFAPVG